LTEAGIEFLEAHLTAFIGIETSKDRIHAFRGSFRERRESGKFIRGKQAVLAGDLFKLFGPFFSDLFADGVAGGFAFCAGDFSIAIGVDFSAVLFASGLAGFLDGLALCFVDTTVVVGVV
jgi:hypothetical protein